MADQEIESSTRNILLRDLSPDDAALIVPQLKAVELGRRFVLERPGKPIENVYFPDTGIASTVAFAGRDRRAEVGLFGWDGMSGISIVLGTDRTSNECFMQVGGAGQRLSSDGLRQALEASPTLRLHLLRFAQVSMVQTSHTALGNARAQLEERLCRWLLMCHDRIVSDTMSLTHEFLATMLGVRRAGVTTAMHTLEGRGLIRASRGKIEIVDRDGLKVGAGDSYGVPESEYRRIFGVSLREP